MTRLYVTEPGAQVHKVDERLVVRRGDEVLEDIPLIKVDQVLLMGRGVGLTTAALHALTEQGKDVIYTTGRGKFRARVVGEEHKHSRLRQAQALATADPQRALAVASAIVRGKIWNQRVLVRRHAEGEPWAQRALAGMEAMARRVETARNADELRGLEGQAAKEYFGLFRQMLHRPVDGASWGFERRAYYPPPDPLNALLSFGYTLLLNDLIRGCQLVGLDPALGFFHVIDYGRPSMALDLEEEFRPVIVDSVVLTLVNRGGIALRDFEQGKRNEREVAGPSSPELPGDSQAAVRGVYLTEVARNKFLALYEARVNEQAMYALNSASERTSYRRMFELQAQQMARVILGEAPGYQTVEVR